MRIPNSDFAQHIPDDVGERIRINHTNCPAGSDTRARLYVLRNNDAALAYCHNCGGHGVKTLRRRTRHYDVLKRLVDEHEVARTVQEVKLPDDCIMQPHLWPAEARAWLYGHHLTDDDIVAYSFSYSPSWGRVILPVYEDGKLVFWQGRQIDGGGPKYVSVQGAHKPIFTTTSLSSSPSYFIVEDIISAIRISKLDAGWAGVALLGTDTPATLISRLANPHCYVVWLDNDEAGRRKAPALIEHLKLCGERVVWTMRGSPPQAKNLSDHELKTLLKDDPVRSYVRA